MTDSSDIRPYIEVLRGLFEARGLSRNAVEKKLGWSRGHLTKILQQKNELKIKHVLSILQVLGVEPSVFYGLVHPSQGAESKELSDRVVAQLDPSNSDYKPVTVPASLTDEELDRRISEAVARAIEEQRRK